MTAPLIIAHANCNDGFAAAWVAWMYFARKVEFHFAGYSGPSNELPAAEDRDIFILDFSYSRQKLELLASRNRSVIVLDHHKTAAMDLAFLPAPSPVQFWEDSRSANIIGHLSAQFDMNRSGAGMAWDYFFPDQPRPSLIEYVQDRDLWRFKDPDTRSIHSALSSYPYDFETWSTLDKRMQTLDALLELIAEGKTLDRMHLKLCKEIIEQTRRLAPIGGHIVPVCNAPYAFASDIGNIMCKGHPFAATYVEHEGGATFSLRSSPEGIDASEVAKKFGGGGHRNSCGFTVHREADGGLTWPA